VLSRHEFVEVLPRDLACVSRKRLVGSSDCGSTPDKFLIWSRDDGTVEIFELHKLAGEFYFRAACEELLAGVLVVGWGHQVIFLVRGRVVATTNLGSYFYSLHRTDRGVVVADAQRVRLFEQTGQQIWVSRLLAVDGVVVSSCTGGVVHGEGEWDPPGGWVPFSLSLSSGDPA
jgi:hypothetical protein